MQCKTEIMKYFHLSFPLADKPEWLSLTSACEVILHFLFDLLLNGNLLSAFGKVMIITFCLRI